MFPRGFSARWLLTPVVLTSVVATIALTNSRSAFSEEAIAPSSTSQDAALIAQSAAEQPSEALINRVLQAASRDLDIPQSELSILRINQETWMDSCLGLGGPAELCAQMLVEGWQFEVVHEGHSWFYRTDRTGNTIRRSTQANNLLSSVRDRLLNEAATQLQLPVDELRVVGAEPRTWDGCLGIVTTPDQVCTQIGIFGWRTVVQQGMNGEQWVFHTNHDASEVRLNATAVSSGNPDHSGNCR